MAQWLHCIWKGLHIQQWMGCCCCELYRTAAKRQIKLWGMEKLVSANPVGSVRAHDQKMNTLSG